MESTAPIASVCEESVFGRIHHELSIRIRNFLYYRCGDLELSNDLCQESFVKLWEHCKTVSIDKAKSYLYTVAGRLFIDSVRHNKVHLSFAAERPPQVNKEDPDFILNHAEFKEHLEKAINGLPETQREVFLMNRIDKMTYSEIADSLEISVKAVEKRMHLALLALKDKVKELKIHKI
jgi:RNA polymerase sigma-70 factor (ECF subfamily)